MPLRKGVQRDPVTNAEVAAYLRTHKLPPPKSSGPEFLMADACGLSFYLRWPNGTVKWESGAALAARGIAIPDRCVLEPRHTPVRT